MAKRKSPCDIGYRAFEECQRISDNMERLGKQLGGSKTIMYTWADGTSPSAMFLQRLHYMGADVMYILTGVRLKT